MFISIERVWEKLLLVFYILLCSLKFLEARVTLFYYCSCSSIFIKAYFPLYTGLSSIRARTAHMLLIATAFTTSPDMKYSRCSINIY
jgi:hypothetical protein